MMENETSAEAPEGLAMSVGHPASTSQAASLDGRVFTFRVSRQAPLVPGEIVLLTGSDGGRFLGQVVEQDPVEAPGAGVITGAGVMIASLGPDDAPVRAGRRPFLEATIEAAAVEHLEALQRSDGAALPIGTWHSGGAEAPARLRASGFNRHTFLCGQSGSGKTYALGVILEQLIIGTELRMIVLDPNADFVRLGETLPDAPAEAIARLGETEIRVLRANGNHAEPLRMRLAAMPRRAQAAVLKLDPISDRDEYSQFLQTIANLNSPNVMDLIENLNRGGPDERALAQRIENLGLGEWEVWAGELASAAEIVAGGSRVTVLDLGGFRDPLEPLAVTLDLLESLWRGRADRIPTLIVIDEAHNLCTAEPSSPVQAAVTERLVQIAAEGRKYGLWLLLSTQRPSKVHPQVLSQCDNLALMRVNSRGDLAELATVFGFAPAAMLGAAPSFAQGEVLVAGSYVPMPSFVQMGSRLTVEGGSDVAVPTR